VNLLTLFDKTHAGYSPPELTWRLAELYGLVPYILPEVGVEAGSELYLAEQQKQCKIAQAKGVRFCKSTLEDIMPTSHAQSLAN